MDTVELKLQGVPAGEVRRLQPHRGAFEVTDLGVYSLRSTGEQGG
jgi:hypothetical protein